MNYHNITKCDMLNGEGVRVALWVSGCSCHCKGCHNPETWSFDSGIPFKRKAKKELFKALNQPYIQGITFTGGHPLEEQNIQVIFKLCKKIKKKFPNKDIWIYSGYTFENIKDFPIMKYIDILIDGKFVKELQNNSLHWVGSSNQRIIDVQESLRQNRTILWNERTLNGSSI